MPPQLDASPEALRRRATFRACERALHGHGIRGPREVLAQILEEVEEDDEADLYGSGPLIASLEARVARLLNKPASCFFISGTQAQQAALRLACEDKGLRRVGYHPTCHLELHCADTLTAIHGIERVLVGPPHALFDLADLQALPLPIAALLTELPQREIGGPLPSWGALQAESDWAREAGVWRHLDGARLFESQPHYGRSHAEIAALFDSVYVSCYKGLGGLSGAFLAGPASFIARARVLRQQLGGQLVHHYPALLAARAGLNRGFTRFARYAERARAVAAILREIPGLQVTPEVPPTNLMHVLVRADREATLRASLDIAETEKVRLITGLKPTEVPGTWRFELAIGDAAEALSDDEVEALFRRLMTRALEAAP